MRSEGETYSMPLHFNLVSIQKLLERKTETPKCPKLPRDITVGMCHSLPNNQLGQLQTSKQFFKSFCNKHYTGLKEMLFKIKGGLVRTGVVLTLQRFTLSMQGVPCGPNVFSSLDQMLRHI